MKIAMSAFRVLVIMVLKEVALLIGLMTQVEREYTQAKVVHVCYIFHREHIA